MLKLCENWASGKYDSPLASLGREQAGAYSLDLSNACMKTLKAKIQEVWVSYSAEFPAQPQETVEANPNQVPSAQIDNGASSG